MRHPRAFRFAIAVSFLAAIHAHAQAPVDVQQRMEAISTALSSTQQQLEESQRKIAALQKELADLRAQIPPTAAPSTAAAEIPLEEREQAVEAAVKLHDQTKVESTSKYPVRVTGLILFNTYVNRGVPDNTDLPAIAARSSLTSGSGSFGASLRQTILGLEADGPRVAGARTSAYVNFDFFSGLSYTNYGTPAGTVRMRTAAIALDWQHDQLEFGMVAPLISPLSPTSYATVAEPALASAGNLWTWAPQIKLTHRQPLSSTGHMQYEFGLWDPVGAGYNSNQLFRNASPGELSTQPGYESRISYSRDGDHALQLGVGSYYSRASYPGYNGTTETEHTDAWAVTADWRIPLSRWFEFSGEGYRGRSIGGLGGGVYKDVITGTTLTTGAPAIQPLNAAGGWSQLHTRFSSTAEANISMGQDNGFARDFHAVLQPANASNSQLRARNRMLMANFIYRPKTYLILSPEFRRVWTWPINGPANTLNVYTLSIGFQF